YGYRATFAAGMLLLGGPVPALLGPHSMVTIVAVSMARGVGFGLSAVVIGAVVAASVPGERRGEGIGRAGVVACVPAIVALPSGVWLAHNVGYPAVIAITAISALAPLAAVPRLAGPAHPRDGGGPAAPRAGADPRPPPPSRTAAQPAVGRPAAPVRRLRVPDRIGRRGRRLP